MTAGTVAQWVARASRVSVLTGAGISTESGIPDFRGPNGLWTKNPAAQRMFSIDDYVADPQLRIQAWQARREHAAWTAEPNPAHRALVDLERAGRLRAIVTQNIDGLHQRAGSSPDLVLEIHGTIHEVVCLACGDRTSMRSALQRVADGEPDPPCLVCGGLLKSATIAFGQSLDVSVHRASVAAARDCDVFLAAGTSLQVQPAASLCEVAVANGARLVICNAEPTPYDDLADAVIRDPLGQALPELVSAS